MVSTTSAGFSCSCAEEVSLCAAGAAAASLGGFTALLASTAVSSRDAGSDGSGAAVLTGGIVSAVAGAEADGGGEAAGTSLPAGAAGESVAESVSGAGGASLAGSASVAGASGPFFGSASDSCASDKGVRCCVSAWFASGVAGSADGSTCSTASVGCWASLDANVTSGICLSGRLANSSWVARSKAAAPRPKISIEIASTTTTNRERKPGNMRMVAPSRVSSPGR